MLVSGGQCNVLSFSTLQSIAFSEPWFLMKTKQSFQLFFPWTYIKGIVFSVYFQDFFLYLNCQQFNYNVDRFGFL